MLEDNLRLVDSLLPESANTIKKAACRLARLHGKEPLAIANSGHEEWKSYVFMVAEILEVVEAILEDAASSIPPRRPALFQKTLDASDLYNTSN